MRTELADRGDEGACGGGLERHDASARRYTRELTLRVRDMKRGDKIVFPVLTKNHRRILTAAGLLLDRQYVTQAVTTGWRVVRRR